MSTHGYNETNSHIATGSLNSNYFEISVVQHPVRARMCGFGEKDRRPIDPPPAVQLKLFDQNWEPVEFTEAQASSMIMSVSLWSQDGHQLCNLVIDPSSIPASNNASYDKGISVLSLREPRMIKNLIGTTISSSFFLLDHNNKNGIFFIFNDLSVRTEGSIDMNSSVFAEVISDVFEVYSAKRFPGMTPSTSLSKAFSEQGIRIPIRTKARIKKKPSMVLEERCI
ncbi:hypothetical protein BB560_006850 [Smittium megazygosporum]|uniref:Velvet domain-containing protein n=1 Tax=Smittium megazygosporum TaxID=133381 RepID=A0A2T9Y0W5_9FUNG|nr:hypothetical protein BB560_006850 [Smittium megazygosporum]